MICLADDPPAGSMTPDVPRTVCVATVASEIHNLPALPPLPPSSAGGREIEWPLLALRRGEDCSREVVCKGTAGGSPSPGPVLVL